MPYPGNESLRQAWIKALGDHALLEVKLEEAAMQVTITRAAYVESCQNSND
jgi:hypothetical protein